MRSLNIFIKYNSVIYHQFLLHYNFNNKLLLNSFMAIFSLVLKAWEKTFTFHCFETSYNSSKIWLFFAEDKLVCHRIYERIIPNANPIAWLFLKSVYNFTKTTKNFLSNWPEITAFSFISVSINWSSNVSICSSVDCFLLFNYYI
jgi:hypothetical protein